MNARHDSNRAQHLGRTFLIGIAGGLVGACAMNLFTRALDAAHALDGRAAGKVIHLRAVRST